MKLLIYISLTLLHFAFYCDTALFTGTSEASTRSTTLKVQESVSVKESAEGAISFPFPFCVVGGSSRRHERGKARGDWRRRWRWDGWVYDRDERDSFPNLECFPKEPDCYG
ncbi:hypothetical protein AAC387_Pa08g2415 [Persea americana]